MARIVVSVGGIVFSLLLLVLGGFIASAGGGSFGGWIFLVGLVGVGLSFAAASRGDPIERRLDELDRLVERGILEPQERDQKAAALLEAA